MSSPQNKLRTQKTFNFDSVGTMAKLKQAGFAESPQQNTNQKMASPDSTYHIKTVIKLQSAMAEADTQRKLLKIKSREF